METFFLWVCLQCLNRILLALLWFFETKTLGNVYTKITQTTNEWSLSHWEKKIYQKWNSRWNRWISNKRNKSMVLWMCELQSSYNIFIFCFVWCLLPFFFHWWSVPLLIHQWIFTFILLLLCCISLVIVFFRKRTNRLGKCKKLKWKWFVCKKI